MCVGHLGTQNAYRECEQKELQASAHSQWHLLSGLGCGQVAICEGVALAPPILALVSLSQTPGTLWVPQGCRTAFVFVCKHTQLFSAVGMSMPV